MSSRVDSVADQLRQQIFSGLLPPGALLPPERDLAAQLGVTRGTARSAIQRLLQAGLVTARQGSGTRVSKFTDTGGPDLLTDLALHATGTERQALVADLLLVRRHLAMAVLERWLVLRPSTAEATRAVEAFEALARDGAGTAALAEADARILQALVTAVESPTLQLTINPVRAVLSAMPDLRAAMYREPTVNAAAWRALLVALEADVLPIDAMRHLMQERDAATLESL